MQYLAGCVGRFMLVLLAAAVRGQPNLDQRLSCAVLPSRALRRFGIAPACLAGTNMSVYIVGTSASTNNGRDFCTWRYKE